MAGVMQLRPQHVAAMTPGPGADCAGCASPWTPPAPPPVPPLQQAVVRFQEFKDYRSLYEVHNQRRPIVPAHWAPIAAQNRVYLFRRQGGRTRVVATLGPGQSYTIPGGAADVGAEYLACLSHVPLLPQRLDQYCDPNNFLALKRRCFPFNPADRMYVRPGGGGSYDMVLPDWRRLAMETHAGEHEALERMHAFAEDPARSQERLLAELTLGTARQYERHDNEV